MPDPDDALRARLSLATLPDSRWRVRDELGLGGIDTSAWLHELERVDANRVRFGFFGHDEWTLAAHAPRWRLHRIAATVTHLLGPVTRPFGRLLARSCLRLEGSDLASEGRHMRVRT